MIFRKKQSPPDATGFYATAVPAADLQPNQKTVIILQGDKIILTLWEGKIIAFSAECPHAGADLTKGEVYKGRVDCPEHNWRFDIQTGRVLYPPDEACRLKRFETKVENGLVWIKK